MPSAAAVARSTPADFSYVARWVSWGNVDDLDAAGHGCVRRQRKCRAQGREQRREQDAVNSHGFDRIDGTAEYPVLQMVDDLIANVGIVDRGDRRSPTL